MWTISIQTVGEGRDNLFLSYLVGPRAEPMDLRLPWAHTDGVTSLVGPGGGSWRTVFCRCGAAGQGTLLLAEAPWKTAFFAVRNHFLWDQGNGPELQ